MAIFGALPAGAYQTPPFSPQPEQSFQWGPGGRRMTPDEIAFNRRLGAHQAMGDYSPVQSPWQGLARVAENLSGAFRERGADRAADRNATESQRIMDAIINPPAPVQGGAVPPGGSSPAPGGINPAVIAALSSPYVDDSAKSLAMLQYKQELKKTKPIEVNGKLIDPATFEVIKDFSSQPEIVRLSQIANDPTQPEYVRRDVAARLEAMNDPVITLPGGGLATRSMVTSTQPVAAPAGVTFTPIDDADADQGGAILEGSSNSGFITPEQDAQIRASFGPNGQAAYQAWLAQHGIKVSN